MLNTNITRHIKYPEMISIVLIPLSIYQSFLSQMFMEVQATLLQDIPTEIKYIKYLLKQIEITL